MKLSIRLQQIHHLIPEGSRVADIGSDHALLPIAAIQSGRASKVIAGEVNDGPYQSACKHVQQSGLSHKIDVRKGDGLGVITRGEVDVITISGMGGALMTSILNEGRQKLISTKKIILQPNVGAHLVRKWLFDHDWVLAQEMLVLDSRCIYDILVAVPQTDDTIHNNRLYCPYVLKQTLVTQEMMFLMGPYLLKKPTPLFFKKWGNELTKLEYAIVSMSRSHEKESKYKATQWTERMNQCQEVLTCLQQDKQ